MEQSNIYRKILSGERDTGHEILQFSYTAAKCKQASKLALVSIEMCYIWNTHQQNVCMLNSFAFVHMKHHYAVEVLRMWDIKSVIQGLKKDIRNSIK